MPNAWFEIFLAFFLSSTFLLQSLIFNFSKYSFTTFRRFVFDRTFFLFPTSFAFTIFFSALVSRNLLIQMSSTSIRTYTLQNLGSSFLFSPHLYNPSYLITLMYSLFLAHLDTNFDNNLFNIAKLPLPL